MPGTALVNNRFLPRAQPTAAPEAGLWELTGNDVSLVDNANTVTIGADAPVGGEKLRVVGDVRIEGGATVTGTLDAATIDRAGTIDIGAAAGTTITVGRSGQRFVVDSESISLTEQAGDPGATADEGQLYTKDVLTITELFFQDSAANVVQLTSGGNIVGGTDIPILDNVGIAFTIHQGTDEYIVCTTLNGASNVQIGNPDHGGDPNNIQIHLTNAQTNAFLMANSHKIARQQNRHPKPGQ